MQQLNFIFRHEDYHCYYYDPNYAEQGSNHRKYVQNKYVAGSIWFVTFSQIP